MSNSVRAITGVSYLAPWFRGQNDLQPLVPRAVYEQLSVAGQWVAAGLLCRRWTSLGSLTCGPMHGEEWGTKWQGYDSRVYRINVQELSHRIRCNDHFASRNCIGGEFCTVWSNFARDTVINILTPILLYHLELSRRLRRVPRFASQ